MKKYIIIIGCLFSLNAIAQSTPSSKLLSFNEAKNISKTQNKPIVLYYTDSKDCETCDKTNATFFASEAYKTIANKVVLVVIDEENKTVPEWRLISHYNKTQTFPSLVTVDYNGRQLGNHITKFDNATIKEYITFLNTL